MFFNSFLHLSLSLQQGDSGSADVNRNPLFLDCSLLLSYHLILHPNCFRHHVSFLEHLGPLEVIFVVRFGFFFAASPPFHAFFAPPPPLTVSSGFLSFIFLLCGPCTLFFYTYPKRLFGRAFVLYCHVMSSAVEEEEEEVMVVWRRGCFCCSCDVWVPWRTIILVSPLDGQSTHRRNRPSIPQLRVPSDLRLISVVRHLISCQLQSIQG